MDFFTFFLPSAKNTLSCRSTGGLQAVDYHSAVGRPSGDRRGTVGNNGKRKVKGEKWKEMRKSEKNLRISKKCCIFAAEFQEK